MFINRLNTFVVSGLVAVASSLPAHADPVDFKATASVDSTTMMQGSKTTMTVEIVGPLPGNAHIDFDNNDPDVEITPNGNPEIKDLGNNRRQIKELFTVQIFDSGLYSLPPAICLSGNDTVKTNSPVVKVDPVPLDSANLVIENNEPVDVTIHDYSDLASIKNKFFDFMPDWVSRYWWWILVGIVLVGGFIFVYFKWLRHGKIPLIPTRKPIPPYDLAVGQLNSLRDKKLWQNGAEKEYYTQLTDILRTYLAGRFGINAMEMTSHQIACALKDNEATAEYGLLVNAVLTEADFVKFAKARPLADENQRAFDNALQFVELTKPVEEPKSDTEEKNDSEKSSSDGDEKRDDQPLSDNFKKLVK